MPTRFKLRPNRPVKVLTFLLLGVMAPVVFYTYAPQSASPLDLVSQPFHAAGKFGYLGAKGQILVSPQFDGADSFSDGMARVIVGGRYGFIDSSGALVIPPKFTWAAPFHAGFASVRTSTGWKWVDRAGNTVLGPTGNSSPRADG